MMAELYPFSMHKTRKESFHLLIPSGFSLTSVIYSLVTTKIS